MRQKILRLFEEVKKIEQKSGLVADKSRHAANEASGGLASSYSAAGDVEHATNSANLSMQKYSEIKKLSEELQNCLDRELPDHIEPVCWVLVKYLDGSKKDLYFVENPVFIDGFNLISINSPLGNSLNGKKNGEKFSYLSGGQNFEGEILEIG